MTDEEFNRWWLAQTFGNATPEQREAWRAFIRAFDEEHSLTSKTIVAVPLHARPQFMAAYTLIFG